MVAETTRRERVGRLGRALFVLAACLAVTPILAGKLTVNHDADVDFSRFRTYAWDDSKGLVAARPDIQQVIVQSIDRALAQSGLKKVDAADADLHVVTYAISESFGGTVSGFYRPPEWTVGFITVDSRMVSDGALVIDIFDAGETKLVWHALAQGTVTSRQQAKNKIEGYVNKAFRGFPPAPAKGKKSKKD